MRTLVTGSNGTVGKAFVQALRSGGYEVIGWDRAAAPPSDAHAVKSYTLQHKPDIIVHLAVPSVPTGLEDEGARITIDWSVQLAELAKEVGACYLFASTAMVFSNSAPGPFRVTDAPDEEDGYGGEKAKAERAVLAANQDAVVARLGWQIGDRAGSNNMIEFLTRSMIEKECVDASTKWMPACSFLEDTASALCWCLDQPGGIYHVDSNSAGHSFADIAKALSVLHDHTFAIVENEDFVYDQRLLDERVPIKALAERLDFDAID
ncbi:MAG: sugar nucleotide-binding protein [Planctomycetota bacterium]